MRKSAQTIEAVISATKQGKTTRQIESELSVSPKTTAKILRDNGIVVDKRERISKGVKASLKKRAPYGGTTNHYRFSQIFQVETYIENAF